MRSSVLARYAGAAVLALSFFAILPSAQARARPQCFPTSAQTVACRIPAPLTPEADRAATVFPNVEARLLGYVEYSPLTCIGNSGGWTVNTPPTRGTTRTEVVPMRLSNGDCPGILMPFNFIFYTWTSAAKAVFTDTFDATWQSPNFTIAETFNITLAHIEVTLTMPPPLNKYLITAAPEMPVIKASAKVVGIVPDPTPTTIFTWTANLTTKKGTGEVISHKNYIAQKQITIGTDEYTFELTNANDVIGGSLTLEAKAVVSAVTLTATSPEGAIIDGTNPPRASIQSRVDMAVDGNGFSGLRKVDVKDAVKRIGCQESKQRQFKAAADGGTGPGLISPDNGVGAYQITSGNPIVKDPPIVYDWRKNTDAGTTIFSSKTADSNRYPGSLRSSTDYRIYISETINPDRCARGLDPIGLPPVAKKPKDTYSERCMASLILIPGDPPAANFTKINLLGTTPVNQLLEDGVRGYNGFAGPKLFGLFLHEFQPDENFLKTAPDSDLDTLPKDSDIWQRVPVSNRGSKGDPNYVSNVTSQQATCN
jgi:hypothetical protein